MSIFNNFNSMKADLKDTYSNETKKKDRFKRTKAMLAPNGKATAGARASKDPMKALKDKSYLNIKKVKGVAV